MAGRPPCWTTHLGLALLVLAAAARCSADQQQQHSGDALDQLLALVSRAVTAATEPIVAELGRQRTLLESIVSRLDSQDTRLSSQDSRLDALNARMDALLNSQDANMGTLKAGQDVLKTGLDALNARLNSRGVSQNASQGTSQNTSEGASQDDSPNSSPNSSQNTLQSRPVLPRDCSDLPPDASTGIYTLQPGLGGNGTAEAFCDLTTDGGGWTVIQRRADIRPRQNFYQTWAEYQQGFGNITGEFWWGLDKLWMMTSALDRRYELRVDLEDFDGEKRHALYQDFAISSENNGYRLTFTNYSGDAGDSLRYHKGQRFSTKDRDQDSSWIEHCARDFKGAWWYNECHRSNLNGEYLSGDTASGDRERGIIWYHWKGFNYSLKTVEMKVRSTRHG